MHAESKPARGGMGRARLLTALLGLGLPRVFGAACHLRTPRRCGHVLSPGGHALQVLHPQAVVPPNLLYVNVTKRGRAALVCVPAKAGSTSFYFWLFHVLAGVPWPYTGEPWVQNVASARWANVSARVVRFASLNHRTRARVLSDASVRRYALVRHPHERGLSAFYSKIACNTGDRADHLGAIRQLIRQARPRGWLLRTRVAHVKHCARVLSAYCSHTVSMPQLGDGVAMVASTTLERYHGRLQEQCAQGAPLLGLDIDHWHTIGTHSTMHTRDCRPRMPPSS